MIKVKCFGVAREIIKSDYFELNRSDLSVKELRSALYESHPEFSMIKGFMIAVNQEYATDEMAITANDEVAIIPPVSGG
ncbi:MAG: MoaD/ThiS family protein [Bacteroidota bacterium]